MYLDHFGLTESPFRITPDTEVFFRGANRGATLEALVHAILNDEGIVKVTGEVGSGKTTLCRVLIERLPQQVDTIMLANPSLSRDEILFALADEMKLSLPTQRISVLVRELQNCLIERYAAGKRTVVLIDEAHAMPRETLEEIRLLSNLETNRHKLLQLVLFGQPELNDILGVPEMRQIRERITHNFTLEPLVRADVTEYIDFRLRAAGYHGPMPFNEDALRMIARTSKGLTRRINILADKSMLAAFATGTHAIGAKEVRAAIADAEFVSNRRWPLVAGGIAAAVIAAAGAGLAWRHWGHGDGSPAPAGAAAPPATATGGPPPAETTAQPASPAATAPVAPTPATPSPSPTPSPTPSPAPSAAPPPPQAPATAAPAGATPPAPQPAAPPAASAPVSAAAPQPAPAAAPAAPPQSAVVASLGAHTQARLAATADWRNGDLKGKWCLQVLTSPSKQTGHIESFVTAAENAVGADGVRLLFDGETDERVVVLLGDFPDREAAKAAMAKLPPALRAYRPYPRPATAFR